MIFSRVSRTVFRVLRRLYCNVNIVFFTREAGRELEQSSGAGRLDILIACDESSIAHLSNYAQYRGVFLAEFSKKAKAVVGVANSQIIHYSFLSETPIVIGELLMEFDPGTGGVYIYNSFTLAEFRGKGIYSDILRFIASKIEARFFHICSRSNNSASIRAISRSGFSKTGDVKFINVAGFRSYSGTFPLGLSR